jgi:signal peptidase I
VRGTAPQDDNGTRFIKRIVAGPGAELYVKEGDVYRKAAGSSAFVKEQNSFTRECGVSPECNFTTPITVPPGDWYLLGDNRGESDDSRFWGPSAHGVDRRRRDGHRIGAI